jgi:hypothetical protein
MAAWIARRAARKVLAVSIERMEPRVLLSQTMAIDPSFGTNGHVPGYFAQGVLSDGSIIARNDGSSLVRLHPDGTLASSYSGPVPPPPSTSYHISGSFSVSVTDAAGESNRGVLIIERRKANGRLDPSFGNDGSVGLNTGIPESDISIEDTLIGPDGSFYVAYNGDNYGSVLRVDSAGNMQGFLANGGADFEIDSIAFEPDGRLLVLEAEEDGWTLLRMPKNDLPSYITNQEYLDVTLNDGNPDDNNAWGTPARMFLRDDGEAIITGRLNDLAFQPGLPAGSTENYIFAVKLGQFPGNASVSGRVFNDANANGKSDLKEAGLSWWQVYSDTNDNGVFDPGEPTAFTDKIGEYALSNLPAGKNIIREVRQNSWTRTQPGGEWPAGFYSVRLSANQQKPGLNFGNSTADHRTGGISGIVYNDFNGDQLKDNGEKGLSGWQVYADTNDNGVYDIGEPIATTNASGQFTIAGLQEGGYRIREIRKSGWVRTQPFGDWPLGYYDVVLAAGQNKGGFAFGNAIGSSPYGTIGVTIYNDANGNGKLDPGELPLANQYVAYFDGPSASAWNSPTSPLLPGHYTFGVTGGLAQGGKWIPTGVANYAIDLRPSQHFSVIFLLHFVPLASISG